MKQINTLNDAREKIIQLRNAAKGRFKKVTFENGREAKFGQVGDDKTSFVDEYGILHAYDNQTNALVLKEMILPAFNAIPKTCFHDLLMVESPYSVKPLEDGKLVIYAEDGTDNPKVVTEYDSRRGLDAWKTMSKTHYMVRRPDGGMSCVKDVYASSFEHPLWGQMYIGNDGGLYGGVRNQAMHQTIGIPIGESCIGQRQVRINHDLEARACETAQRGYDPVFMKAAKSLYMKIFGGAKVISKDITPAGKKQPQWTV